MIDSLTEFLVEVGEAGEASEEFMELYQKVVSTGDWRYYLAVKGVLQLLAKLISKEIEHFGRLEQTRLSSDLALGYAVKQLTAPLSSLLHHGKTLLSEHSATFLAKYNNAFLSWYIRTLLPWHSLTLLLGNRLTNFPLNKNKFLFKHLLTLLGWNLTADITLYRLAHLPWN